MLNVAIFAFIFSQFALCTKRHLQLPVTKFSLVVSRDVLVSLFVVAKATEKQEQDAQVELQGKQLKGHT